MSETKALTTEQESFLDALVTHKTLKATCEATSIAPNVLAAWRKQEAFVEMLDFTKSQITPKRTPEEIEAERVKKAAHDAEHRARLASDPRIGVLAFIAKDLLALPVSEVAKWVRCDRHILENHVAEHMAGFQQLASLPLAIAAAELRRQAA